jgi:hypothetical protein
MFIYARLKIKRFVLYFVLVLSKTHSLNNLHRVRTSIVMPAFLLTLFNNATSFRSVSKSPFYTLSLFCTKVISAVDNNFFISCSPLMTHGSYVLVDFLLY